MNSPAAHILSSIEFTSLFLVISLGGLEATTRAGQAAGTRLEAKTERNSNDDEA
jgi:hypothetical protein